MKKKYEKIACISIFLMAFDFLAGCGDEERAAIDQPAETEKLARQEDLREHEEDARVRRQEIQEEQQVAQEQMAERQNPEAAIPMPPEERRPEVEEQPRGPRGEREIAGAASTEDLAPDKGTTPIDADMIGKQVASRNGRKLGNVIDIFRGVVGESDYALVQSTDKRIYPVPIHLFGLGARSEGLELPFDQVSFEKAPSFQETEQQLLYDPEFAQRVRSYYREQTLTEGQRNALD